MHEQVDFGALGEQFSLTGGSIKSAVFRAAVEASLQPDESKRVLTMASLQAVVVVSRMAD